MTLVKVVIPARFNSSRLPGKPLLEINGKPILWHVYQRCIEAGFSREDVVLATDDSRIFAKAEELNLSVVMTSSAHESGTDRINEVASLKRWHSDDLVINVQGDEPLIPVKLIKDLVKFALERPCFSMFTAVTHLHSLDSFHNSNVVKAIVGEQNQALYFTRAAAPLSRDNITCLELAYRHIGIYGYTVSALKKFCSYKEAPLEVYEKLEQLRALSHGMSIGVCHYLGELPHGVDTPEDYELIKEIMESKT
ncbi:3-deoxy-manno-octulosonate cytidylyltransferase [Agarivorans sp. QJM3NY_25]|uniref:3-deoxy-manno-octulosonate cytidylyltransferase n=1 Tax=Agarivorans sp. QJM3NY_25 TaxID=3421430 RepID=UPI003D7ED9A5